jgi:hypothetical protein
LSAITSGYLKNWNAKTNEQINDDPTAFLCERRPSGLLCNTLIEATLNTKGGSWDCGIERDLKVGRYRIRQSMFAGQRIRDLPMSQ